MVCWLLMVPALTILIKSKLFLLKLNFNGQHSCVMLIPIFIGTPLYRIPLWNFYYATCKNQLPASNLIHPTIPFLLFSDRRCLYLLDFSLSGLKTLFIFKHLIQFNFKNVTQPNRKCSNTLIFSKH